jgi:large subunit ribosomal protein L31
MPKKKIHPEYKEITIVLTDGTEIKTKSTLGGRKERLLLDVDCLQHPAWNPGKNLFSGSKQGRVAMFKQKYGDI